MPDDADDDQVFLVARHSTRLRVVHHVPLLLLADRDRLFAGERFTAEIWPRLESGLSVAEFTEAAAAADRDGRRVIAELLGAGAIQEISTDEGVVPVASRLCVDLGNLSVCLNFAGDRSASIAKAMLCHLETAPRALQVQLVIVEKPDAMGVARCGGAIGWARWEQAAPVLKVALTELALEHLDQVALHVATLSTDDGALLIVGAPGAGKSTLSVALGASGFRLEGDDVGALEPDGRVRALPFPATLKSGAWPLLDQLRPDLDDRPVFVRPDEQRVRYIPLDSPGVPPARPVRCVLSLNREEAAAPCLEPLAVDESIAALLEGAWSRDKRLSPTGFEALAACVEGAAFFRLTYSDLATGIPLAETAWRMAGKDGRRWHDHKGRHPTAGVFPFPRV